MQWTFDLDQICLMTNGFETNTLCLPIDNVLNYNGLVLHTK